MEWGKVCRDMIPQASVMADIVVQEEIGSRLHLNKTMVTWNQIDHEVHDAKPLSAMNLAGQVWVYKEEIVISQEPPNEELSQLVLELD